MACRSGGCKLLIVYGVSSAGMSRGCIMPDMEIPLVSCS